MKAYKNCFRQFIRHYDEIKPSQLTRKHIDDYVLGLIREKRISESHQSQILSAIKMFYAEVISQEHKVQGLLRPKRPDKLPQVLTEEEVTRLLKAVGYLRALRVENTERAAYKRFSPRRRRNRKLIRRQRYIPCAIVLPRIFWRRAWICVTSRISWVMKAARPPRYIRISRKKGGTK